MQTLRVVVLLLIVAVAMLAYALWGRAGRERNAALPQQKTGDSSFAPERK
jgi:hypothetical protein